MKEKKTRRLAAIMFTDIVGYTALMQQDEALAAKTRTRHRQVFEQHHQTYKGDILQYFGDGTLSVFQSSVEAVECALAIQRDLASGIEVPLRIGIHMGDIVVEGADIYGHGVNLASRIESMGVAGAILLSDKLNEELTNQSQVSTVSLGHFEFKNIDQPIEVFAVNNEGIKVPVASELKGKQKEEHKSIVVLPFANMSNDPENEYFSDGISEEIINALTKINDLKVIARASAFAFKNKHVDVRSIGNQLGVTTVLDGSVRKIRNRVRITAQLINAQDGTHYWSKNFDRELDDIFVLQDEISLLIANQIRENFGHFNIQEHLVEKPTDSVKAYELFLKGRFYQLKWSPESIRQAIEHYDQAIEHDPQFARAYYGNMQCYGLLAIWGFMTPEEGFEKSIENFLKGQEINTQLPEYTLSFVGKSLWGDWDFQTAYEHILQTLNLNPHYTDALEAMAELFTATGYFEQAKVYVQRMLDIDPLSANHHYTLANIHYMQREFEEALACLKKSLEFNPDFALALELKIKCLIWLNRKDEFARAVAGKSNEKVYTTLFEVINGETDTVSDELLADWANVFKVQNQLVPYELFILANTKHHNQAIELLSGYIDQKRGQLMNFRQEPFLEKLHELDEFHQLHTSNLVLPSDHENENEKRKPEPLSYRSELDTQKDKLLQYIDAHKPYLDPLLSLSSLAQAIQIHPNQLSLVINERIGLNFNEFINHYRLQSFKEKAIDPANSNLTLLGLAYDSGFNSKTVFNAFFKKAEGITPRAWVKNALKNE